MRYLLDTNTCIAAMRNNAAVVQRLSAVVPSDCAISTITAYELFTGVFKCANPVRERQKVERLLSIVSQLPFDPAAAMEAARIRGMLESTGSSIGPYDVLLAGHAMVLQLILVTQNTREFNRVAGLNSEDWQTPVP